MSNAFVPVTEAISIVDRSIGVRVNNRFILTLVKKGELEATLLDGEYLIRTKNLLEWVLKH